MAVDACDQTRFYTQFSLTILITFHYPVHHLVQWEVFGLTQGYGRKTQF